jgi:hypothetical protein
LTALARRRPSRLVRRTASPALARACTRRIRRHCAQLSWSVISAARSSEDRGAKRIRCTLFRSWMSRVNQANDVFVRGLWKQRSRIMRRNREHKRHGNRRESGNEVHDHAPVSRNLFHGASLARFIESLPVLLCTSLADEVWRFAVTAPCRACAAVLQK